MFPLRVDNIINSAKTTLKYGALFIVSEYREILQHSDNNNNNNNNNNHEDIYSAVIVAEPL